MREKTVFICRGSFPQKFRQSFTKMVKDILLYFTKSFCGKGNSILYARKQSIGFWREMRSGNIVILYTML